MDGWVDVGSVEDFKDTDRKTVKDAVIFKTEDGFYACENRCPHMGYPMNKGTVRDGVVSCAWHNWQFDMKSGGCYRGACDDLQTYEVKVEDGRVLLALEEPYEHFAMHASRLVEGMRASDVFLQAKAISLMQKCGGESEDVAMVAIEQAYRHSQINHQNFQAVYEFQVICDVVDLSENFDQRQKVGILLQGVRTAAGSSGDRMSVFPLPETTMLESKLKSLLERYTYDSSPLGLERLLLNAIDQGAMHAAEEMLLEIATEDYFVGIREAFVCVSAVAHYGETLDISRFKPAFYSWVLGNRRVESDIETKEAITWLAAHKTQISDDQYDSNVNEVDIDELQKLVSGNDLEKIFEGLLSLLNKGVSFSSILNGFSLIAARRFSRIPVNNGGLWNSATEGIRYCHSLRRVSESHKGSYKFKALFHMAFYFFKSRWIKFSGEWNTVTNSSGDWCDFEEAVSQSRVKDASRIAVSLIGDSSKGSWEQPFLKPLLQEDNSTLQLNTLVAVLGEMQHQGEWQHYISGMVTYACDQKLGQTVLSAAKFGRSYLRE
jgi:nitrite reductase/ring-hydroxylating ferredoxin subunit